MNRRFPLVLAYHRVNPQGKDSLSVRVRDFEVQTSYLRKRGWESLTLADYYLRYLRHGIVPPERSFVITFDDGFRDNYLFAYPLLEKYGYNATLFLTVKYIGTNDAFPWQSGPLEAEDLALSWEQVHHLRGAGFEIGSHTLTHPLLTKLSLAAAEKEIVDSKAIIEQRLDEEIYSFCYPSGDFNDAICTLVRRAGYKLAVVTPCGPGIDATDLTLHRVGIYRGDSLAVFRLKISPVFELLRRVGLHKYLAILKTLRAR